MKRFLTLLAAATLTSASSFATDLPVTAAEAIVQRELLQPLAAKERAQSRFSRSRLPAQARRVRLLDLQPQKDDQGAAFVKFAVDARHGLDLDEEGDQGRWRKDAITGCVYGQTGAVFVLRAGAYHPAGILLGKRTKPAPTHTCQTGPAQVANAAGAAMDPVTPTRY